MAKFHENQDSIDNKIDNLSFKVNKLCSKIDQFVYKIDSVFNWVDQHSIDSINLQATISQPLIDTSSYSNLICINMELIFKSLFKSQLSFLMPNQSFTPLYCKKKCQDLNRHHYYKNDQPQLFPPTTNDLIKKIDVEDIEFDDYFILAIFQDWFNTCISSPCLFPKQEEIL